METELYIGLMSGTSMDGIDAVLVDLQPDRSAVKGCLSRPWPADLRRALQALAAPGENEIERLGRLDAEVGMQFSVAVAELLQQTATHPAEVRAIGSHGQTIRHRPGATPPFTLQIGDPNLIAERTGITVVADLRRRDMAAGGQGAPLVPAFHAQRFGSTTERRVILNLGGIANITRLTPDEPVIGFDTGPGNTLLDYWIMQQHGERFDQRGDWAATGQVDLPLLQQLLDDPYFLQPPPKSTGPEHFSPGWLQARLTAQHKIQGQDLQRTLVALTAQSVVDAIGNHCPGCERLIVCGGGVHNDTLMQEIAGRIGLPVETSDQYGIAADQVEATAFAWLAQRTLHGLSGNLPEVTGAGRSVILGGVYPA